VIEHEILVSVFYHCINIINAKYMKRYTELYEEKINF